MLQNYVNIVKLILFNIYPLLTKCLIVHYYSFGNKSPNWTTGQVFLAYKGPVYALCYLTAAIFKAQPVLS